MARTAAATTTTTATAATTTLPEFSGRAFLAPMAGVSDPALRLQCRLMGAGLVVTEFTSIHSIVARHERILAGRAEAAQGGDVDGDGDGAGNTVGEFLEYSEQERPISVQLFGSDLDVLGRAARIVEPFFDIIDYNMGCPAPHITAQMAGGALLQEADLTRRIFSTLVGAVRKPVTLKVRSGVTEADRFLFRDIAEIAEDEGVSMITLHPRTVSQGYSGRADWDMIKELKEVSGVPIVGNGDITTPEDAAEMLDRTGCDYVMVGRGAMGNPFLFEQINDYLTTGSYREYSFGDRLGAFFEYLRLARGFRIRFANIKGQAMRFTKGMPGGTALRSRITASRDMEQLERVMREASGPP